MVRTEISVLLNAWQIFWLWKRNGFNLCDDRFSCTHFGSTLMHSNASDTTQWIKICSTFCWLRLRAYEIQVFQNKCHTTHAHDNMCMCDFIVWYYKYIFVSLSRETRLQKSGVMPGYWIDSEKLNWYQVASLDSSGFRLPKHTDTNHFILRTRACAGLRLACTNPRLTAFVISSNCQS